MVIKRNRSDKNELKECENFRSVGYCEIIVSSTVSVLNVRLVNQSLIQQ